MGRARRRLLTIRLVAIGLVLALIGAVGVVALLTGGVADAIDYSRAGPCPTGVVADGCWSEVPAIVEATRFRPVRRSPDAWEVTLSDRLGIQHVDVEHRELFNRLHGQEPVVARFWNGRPILIRAGGEELASETTPGENLTVELLLAVLLPAGLLLAAWGLRTAARG